MTTVAVFRLLQSHQSCSIPGLHEVLGFDDCCSTCLGCLLITSLVLPLVFTRG